MPRGARRVAVGGVRWGEVVRGGRMGGFCECAPCLDAWRQAIAQQTVAVACKVLTAMPPKCVEELHLQAMLEETVAGAAGLEAY